ncbi:MAG: twin-arginine translocase subunit TatC [Candidatus Aminicenantales bacterium]
MKKGRKSPDEMTFLEHLEELRKRIFNSVIVLVVVVIPSWFFHKQLFDIIARPIKQFLPQGKKLAFINLTEPFVLYIKICFLAAVFIAAPYIFYQLWLFIAPGLFRHEKKYVIPFIIFTTVFFILGALFAYFIAFPFACGFFLKLGAEFEPVITANKYFSLAIRIILGIALVFELPTLVFFLSRMGLITSKWMIKNFKYAVLVVFIIAAVITPSPDVINQCIIAFPMLALYGLGIVIAFIFGPKKKEIEEEEEEEDLVG